VKIEINVSTSQLGEVLSLFESAFESTMFPVPDNSVRGEAFADAAEKDGCGETAPSVRLLLPIYRGLLRHWKQRGTPIATVLVEDSKLEVSHA